MSIINRMNLNNVLYDLHDCRNLDRFGNVIGLRGWNQLVKTLPSSQTISGITVTINGGAVVLNGTATETILLTMYIGRSLVVGHKYLLYGCPETGSASTYYLQLNGISGSTESQILKDVGSGAIGESAYSSGYIFIGIISGTTCTNATFVPQLFDLTAMFGSGNEPTTVSDFRSMFSADYYPYYSGSNIDLLWTNASPTSSFASQTIDVNLSNYTHCYIDMMCTNASSSKHSSIILPVGTEARFSMLADTEITGSSALVVKAYNYCICFL